MRISKAPEVRKAEIIDVAERLFTTKGYNKTTISDIMDDIGIAKGTFYYHFKSKDEVMDAIIMRFVNENVTVAKAIADDKKLSALEKFFQILFSSKTKSGEDKEKVIEQLHQPNNAEMHQKSLVMIITHLAPILTQVVEQGIQEKVMAVDYPQQTIELLLASSAVIFDDKFFPCEAEVMEKRANAMINMAEATLGTKKGALSDIMKLIMG